MISYVLVLFSKKNHVLIEEEDNPSEKVVIVEEELDGIGNLEDLLRLVFIDKGCGNLKVFVDGGDFTRNIKQRSPMFYKPVDVHCVANNMDEIVSSTSMWNVVN